MGPICFSRCVERKELLKKAISALHEYEELEERADAVMDKYRELNKAARIALHKPETALNEYLDQVRKHGC